MFRPSKKISIAWHCPFNVQGTWTASWQRRSAWTAAVRGRAPAPCASCPAHLVHARTGRSRPPLNVVIKKNWPVKGLCGRCFICLIFGHYDPNFAQWSKLCSLSSKICFMIQTLHIMNQTFLFMIQTLLIMMCWPCSKATQVVLRQFWEEMHAILLRWMWR